VHYIIQKVAVSFTKQRNTHRTILELKTKHHTHRKKAANYSHMIETVYDMMNELGLNQNVVGL